MSDPALVTERLRPSALAPVLDAAVLDAAAVSRARDDLRAGLGDVRGLSVVLDLDEVEFVDSSGIGMLVALRQHVLDHGGQFALASLNPQVRRALTLVGLLGGVFDIVDS